VMIANCQTGHPREPIRKASARCLNIADVSVGADRSFSGSSPSSRLQRMRAGATDRNWIKSPSVQ